MEDARSFLGRVCHGRPLLLEEACFGPYASVADVAALPVNIAHLSGDPDVARARTRAKEAALDVCNHSLDFLDGRRGLFKQHTPSNVGGAIPSKGLSYAESTRLTRGSSTTGRGLTPIEHVAAGHEVSAWDLEASFEWAFTEAKRVSSSIAFACARNDRCRAFSFAERCVASGHEELIPRVSLDETLRGHVLRDPIPPLKRIKLTEK